jgi:hypothetical protein
LRKVESQISTSCMYRKTPIIFVKTIISVQFQVQIETSAVQNVANSKACAQQGKSSVAAHQADHDNGPFGHTEQQTTKRITPIYDLARAIVTIVSSVSTVDCCLVSCFQDLIEMAPQWPW